ncbi:MAG: PilZ domain-containing protein [Candidatus Omnitrophica bacterium]|nr:PilZ domain-containing protein [Candidatus Omnitrophota bacterium]
MNPSEKRRFPRIDIRVPLQYKELREGNSQSKGTTTRNLSEGGVKFNTDKFISLACRMVVELTIPTSQKPIRAISKVAWIKKLPVGDDYEIGNQFLDMAKDDRACVADYVQKTMPKGS